MKMAKCVTAQVLVTCFESNVVAMYEHAWTYLDKGFDAVKSLNKEFRDIVKSRNRTRFWADALVWLRQTYPQHLCDLPNGQAVQGACLLNGADDLRELFGSDIEILRAVVRLTRFLHPRSVDLAPVFPNYARTSNSFAKDKKRGDAHVFVDELGHHHTLTLDGNLRAQLAFDKAIPDMPICRSGYEIAHIWGRTYDPRFFTARWNLAAQNIMFRSLTEEQFAMHLCVDGQVFRLIDVLQRLAYDLYFKPNTHNNGAPLQPPRGVVCPNVPVDGMALVPRLIPTCATR